MVDHAINGFNAMPAKGACMDCSDDEIVAAIDHMIAGL
ncbi:cytochrome c5 [Vibrio sp. JCM 19236]|nr:cytochrome c5 [Vibrio sp. JCM 19236]